MPLKINLRSGQKAESRKKILKAASELFRKQGFAATGIDTIVSRAGLTAGGFYNHFRSKTQLLTEALDEAFTESWSNLTAGIKAEGTEKLQKMIHRYLSSGHRDQAESGCPLVGIAAELGRYSQLTSKITSRYLEGLISEAQKIGVARPDALFGIATAVGALLLSRLAQGEPLSEELLEEIKIRLIESQSKTK